MHKSKEESDRVGDVAIEEYRVQISRNDLITVTTVNTSENEAWVALERGG